LNTIKIHTQLVQEEFQDLPMNEPTLLGALKKHKSACLDDFKKNLMGGAELLNSVKGIEY